MGNLPAIEGPVLVHTYYTDIGMQGPRYGCGYISVKRVVRNQEACPGGQRGEIIYQNKKHAVYWKEGAYSTWETRASALDPIKVTRIYGSGG